MHDVFLSYNSRSLAMVAEVDKALRSEGIRPWIDTRELVSGDNAWETLDRGLRGCPSCIVFLGPDGLGRYQQQELWAALARRFSDSSEFRLIPVLLPGVGQEALGGLPSFLSVYVFVEMRSLDDKEALARLVRGIRRDDLVDVVFDFLPVAEGEYRVRLSLDGETTGEGDFAFDLDPKSRTLAKTLPRIDQGDGDLGDLGDIGGQLWDALTPGALGAAFWEHHSEKGSGREFHIRLRLPPDLEFLPWETLYVSPYDFLASHDRFCVVRDQAAVAPGVARREPSPRPEGPLKVLTVIPQGAGLDDHRELESINNALDRLGDVTEVRTMLGRVTLADVGRVLGEDTFDIVHFVGHGRREDDSVALRFNADGADLEAEWVDPGTFATLFDERSGVRLVILNCCFSGGATSGASEGFGPSLLRRGVPAVVTMRYAVRDEVAVAFCKKFYQNLTSNPKPGRIDVALEQTRRQLRYLFNTSEVRAFVTPQLFLSDASEVSLPIQRLYTPPKPDNLQTTAESLPEVPERLLEALREGRLIPVLGPGVLAVGATRDSLPPPGPRRLAELLDERLADAENGGPFAERSDDFKLCDRAGEWFHPTLLQRVCQYHESRVKRLAIIREIRTLFEAVDRPPEALLHIASWPLPGIFCTYFDGLMLRALGGRRQVLVAPALDGEVQREPESLLLVELRGSLQQPRSLVLTEAEEHELLWRRFAQMAPQIESLLSDVLGTSLLFLGCSPRDPLVLRFAHHLSETLAKNLGEIFFVTPRCSEVERSHWARLEPDCEWMEGSLEALIQQISNQLQVDP